MTAEKLYLILSDIDDILIKNAKIKSSPIWLKRTVSVACIALVLLSGIFVLDRFDYGFGAKCSAYPGDIINGVYYYDEEHSGVWSYTPDTGAKKELSTFFFDNYEATQDGIYFWNRYSLYLKDNQDEITRIHTTNPFKYTHISVDILNDGKIAITQHNKRNRVYSEVLIDKNGVSYPTHLLAYTGMDIAYSNRYFNLGDRMFYLQRNGEKIGVYENGNLLTENYSASQYAKFYFGNSLWIPVYSDEEYAYLHLTKTQTEIVILPFSHIDSGTDDFLFFADTMQNKVICYDIKQKNYYNIKWEDKTDLYTFTTDGKYLYSSAPWDGKQACYEIIYNNGVPYAFELIDKDITH